MKSILFGLIIFITVPIWANEVPSYYDTCSHNRSVDSIARCLKSEIRQRIKSNSCFYSTIFKKLIIKTLSKKRLSPDLGWGKLMLCSPDMKQMGVVLNSQKRSLRNKMWLCAKNIESLATSWNERTSNKKEYSLQVIKTMLVFEAITHEAVHLAGFGSHSPKMMETKDKFQKCLGEQPVYNWKPSSSGRSTIYISQDWVLDLLEKL